MDSRTSPSDVVAARVRQVRGKRGLTTAQLAARCAELGAPGLTAQALYKLEGQRESASRRPRPVTVDELLVLAKALHVYPVHLLVPPDDPGAGYEVTASLRASRFRARCWIRGLLPLPFPKVAESRDLWGEVPDDEYEAHEAGQCPCCGGRPPRELGRKSDGEYQEAP